MPFSHLPPSLSRAFAAFAAWLDLRTAARLALPEQLRRDVKTPPSTPRRFGRCLSVHTGPPLNCSGADQLGRTVLFVRRGAVRHHPQCRTALNTGQVRGW